jgi:mannitol/fructose-specific phosphotransferase system IIA component (Ntr-type)
MLRDAVDRRSVAVNAEAESWQAAVELSGELLVAAEVVEERYGPAMVRTVEELGPYVAVAPGVAIPHARPEDGALEMGVSLVVLREPVEFGSEENDPVDLLFGFASPDKDSHVDTIRDLVSFIQDTENLEALRTAASADEALRILKKDE